MKRNDGENSTEARSPYRFSLTFLCHSSKVARYVFAVQFRRAAANETTVTGARLRWADCSSLANAQVKFHVLPSITLALFPCTRKAEAATQVFSLRKEGNGQQCHAGV